MGHLGGDGRPAYANQREIAFYRDVAPAAPVTPRCLPPLTPRTRGAWHLLLEDLTDSHFIATAWPLPPARGYEHPAGAGAFPCDVVGQPAAPRVGRKLA